MQVKTTQGKISTLLKTQSNKNYPTKENSSEKKNNNTRSMPQTYQKGNYNFTLFSLKSDTIRKKKKKKSKSKPELGSTSYIYSQHIGSSKSKISNKKDLNPKLMTWVTISFIPIKKKSYFQNNPETKHKKLEIKATRNPY